MAAELILQSLCMHEFVLLSALGIRYIENTWMVIESACLEFKLSSLRVNIPCLLYIEDFNLVLFLRQPARNVNKSFHYWCCLLFKTLFREPGETYRSSSTYSGTTIEKGYLNFRHVFSMILKYTRFMLISKLYINVWCKQ